MRDDVARLLHGAMRELQADRIRREDEARGIPRQYQDRSYKPDPQPKET